jgi:hypothetical protein
LAQNQTWGATMQIEEVTIPVNLTVSDSNNNNNNTLPAEAKKTDRLGKEVIDLMKRAIENGKSAIGKNIIAIIGNTGTGKSTAVNHFLGLTMKVERNRIKVAAGQTEAAAIGHRPGTSETQIVGLYPKGDGEWFADCTGFQDTRSDEMDIAGVFSLLTTFLNANQVKLVFAFDCNAILIDRGIHFSNALTQAMKLLKNYENHKDSILLMFTKPTPNLYGQFFNAQDAIGELTDIMNDLPPGPQKELYQFILRDQGKYITVCNPLSNESRIENLAAFANMGKISDPNVFQLSYSPKSHLKLMKEMVSIGINGLNLYESYFSNENAIKRYQEEIQKLEEGVAKIKASIQEIGNGNADPSAIEAAEQAILLENKNLINSQKVHIQKAESTMAEIKNRMNLTQQKMDEMDKKGSEEVEYWKDQINQPGINIVSTTTTIHTSSKSGFMGFGGGSSRSEQTSSTVDKRSIPRDFNYRGPEILRVVKDPENGACWSNEKKEKDTYYIHYESGKGEDAKASVKVFVQRRHLPSSVVERMGKQEESNREMNELNKWQKSIAEYQNVIHKAEMAAAAKGTILEKINQYKKSTEELEASKQDYIAKKQKLEDENGKCRQLIQAANSEFAFLKDYIRLSKDEKLKQNEIVSKFLKYDETYIGAKS